MDDRQYPFITILDALRFHARERGSVTAFTFLRSDEERDSITFEELNRISQCVAVALLQKAAPGDRALLVYPPGLEFISAFSSRRLSNPRGTVASSNPADL